MAQTAPNKYWVQFSDKNNSPFSLSHPAQFLSAEAITRRAKFQIPYDERDLPVNESYVNEVLALGNCAMVNRSKWFNAITIYSEDSLLIEDIAQLPFVSEVRSVEVTVQGDKEKFALQPFSEKSKDDVAYSELAKSYGPSFRQTEMLNGHVLHELGYTGKNINIAVLDAGWWRADILPAFDKLRNENRIVAVRDFVDGGEDVYDHSNHGTFVLSLMAGIIPDSLCGTAVDANYWLFRTEEAASEYVVEEDNWVAAAEVCDSLGIDVINSSLGYSLFDDPDHNHSKTEMDGNTTRVTIAADIAAEKGILVVNSAGNSGNNRWHIITAPSDGDSVLCVGAVDANLSHAVFSSFGPSADGDVKPNVCAMGYDCVIADLDSTIRLGNGTSFSSPITAGMAACLWQAFPEKKNMQIFDAIEKSAHLFSNPNDSLGYGMPDFWQAFRSLQTEIHQSGNIQLEVWPNPFSTSFNITIQTANGCEAEIEMVDAAGRIVYGKKSFVLNSPVSILRVDELSTLSIGRYVIRIVTDEEVLEVPLMKLGL